MLKEEKYTRFHADELSKNRDAKIDDSKEAFIESLQDMNEIFKHPTANSSSAAPAE